MATITEVLAGTVGRTPPGHATVLGKDPAAQDVVMPVLPAAGLHGHGPLQEGAGLVNVGAGDMRRQGLREETGCFTCSKGFCLQCFIS